MIDLPVSAVSATALFAFATSITPGPNNTMLLASGVNFGFRRTLPHLLGVSLGLLAILLLASAGLQQWVAAHPAWHEAMKWIGSAYLLYLAWRVAHSQPGGTAGTGDQGMSAPPRPLGFWGAAAFQWVNPKVWVMVLGFFSAYVPASASLPGVVLLCLLFSAVNLPCVGSWALLGDRLSLWLTEGQRRLWFNRCMGALLALSVWGAWRG
jgi:threonine/homoserine/homoserine lactone efflux protein